MRFSLISFLTFLFVHSMIAQKVESKNIVSGTEITSAKIHYLGKSKRVGELTNKDYVYDRSAKIKLSKQKPDNFKNRRNYSKAILPEVEHQGPDQLRQKKAPSQFSKDPFLNIDGIGDEGSPHDPSGDVGREFYVQMINVTYIGIFAKDGTLVKQFSAEQLWEEFNVSSAGDPIVLYDEQADRWLITEFTDPSNLLIAISENANPLGSFFVYTFSTPDFPDYPKYSIWPEAYMLTTNEEGPGVLHHYFFDRAALLAGEADVNMQRIEVPGSLSTEAGFFVASPVDWNGDRLPNDTRPISVVLNDSSWGDAVEDQIELYRFNIDFLNPDSSEVENISIVTSPYDSYPCSEPPFFYSCVPQKDGLGLDAIPEVIMNIPHYRNFENHESLVFSFVTDATDGDNISGIRWVELRRTSQEDWFLYQEGTFAPEDGLDRFMSSIAINKDGSIGLAYNVTSKDSYVGIRYTGRNASDPLGQMTTKEYTVVEGKASINSGTRFGDYAQMSVDPVDQKTFWYTTEYAGNGANVTKTRIVAFQIGRDTFDLGLKAVISPKTGHGLTDMEEVIVEVNNGGLETLNGYTLTYSLDGNVIDTVIIDQDLLIDEVKEVIFKNTIDLSKVGDYQLKVWLNHPFDKNQLNDTITMDIHHLDKYNVTTLAGSILPVICDDSIQINFSLQNNGAETITSIETEVLLDDQSYQTLLITTDIAYDKLKLISFNIPSPSIGQYELKTRINKVNDNIDSDQSDNDFTTNTNILDVTTQHVLYIKTDNYPDETSWDITLDGSNVVLFEGGPYIKTEETKTNLCLEKDLCYVFTMYDSYGDGICCDEGFGNYSITNYDGKEVVKSTGNFGYEEVSKFCTKIECLMELSLSTTPADVDQLGTIFISASNGIEPYKYSIDGGITFSNTPLFEELVPNIYHIVVYSADSTCFASDSIEVKTKTASKDIHNTELTIRPNPTDGYFHVDIDASVSNKNRILLSVLDHTGKIIQEKYVTKYGSTFTAPVSIMSYPSGSYFIKIKSEKGSYIKQIIKK